MAHDLWWKTGAIVALALALLIPLKLIESKIEERQATRAGVVAELANTSVGEQTLSGPVLVLPCAEHYFEETADSKDIRKKERRTRDCTRTYAADQLTVTGKLNTENRYRGIYSARFYVGTFQFRGHFDIPSAPAPLNATREWAPPYIAFSVRDVRGIRSAAGLSWDGIDYSFKPGLQPDLAGAGVHAIVGSGAGPVTGQHTFAFPMEIVGLQNLGFVPSARQHELKLTVDWPHPSFVGRHLPATREIGTRGFEAAWRISDLSSEAPRALAACSGAGCKALDQYVFGVNLFDPVDVYVQANRAIKYALLFVLLTFCAFFMFEIMRDLRIHPVQYGLVGLALAMFFLLLIALSEHIHFVFAYMISASACVVLIALYLHAVLQSAGRAVAFAGMLTALYTMLYALLRSEDHGLLLGALLVFCVLAAVMLLTRRVDWYSIGGKVTIAGASS
ncbi:MAG: cell envelope integrity protein CreD [Burkholderiales bacterium]